MYIICIKYAVEIRFLCRIEKLTSGKVEMLQEKLVTKDTVVCTICYAWTAIRFH